MISETNLYEPRHKARLAIKPGITGMWQVSGRSDITDFEEVVRLDKEYIENWDIGLDIKILLKTVMVVAKGKPRIIEFQLERCVGKLRPTHIYSDTIKIIKEMLAEEGMEGRFGNILNTRDFFPESFFYQFIGYPENIFLYNDIFEETYSNLL